MVEVVELLDVELVELSVVVVVGFSVVVELVEVVGSGQQLAQPHMSKNPPFTLTYKVH